jgi:hypothetical protein
MGLKGLFEISKLLFQYSPEKTGIFDNSPTLQYSRLKFFDLKTLAEASTAADGVIWLESRHCRYFGR